MLSGPAAGLAGDLLATRRRRFDIDRTREIVDAATYGASRLRQAPGAAHDQRDDENQEKMRGLDNFADHGLESTA